MKSCCCGHTNRASWAGRLPNKIAALNAKWTQADPFIPLLAYNYMHITFVTVCYKCISVSIFVLFDFPVLGAHAFNGVRRCSKSVPLANTA